MDFDRSSTAGPVRHYQNLYRKCRLQEKCVGGGEEVESMRQVTPEEESPGVASRAWPNDHSNFLRRCSKYDNRS
jgi:hypothetical protein